MSYIYDNKDINKEKSSGLNVLPFFNKTSDVNTCFTNFDVDWNISAQSDICVIITKRLIFRLLFDKLASGDSVLSDWLPDFSCEVEINQLSLIKQWLHKLILIPPHTD